MELEAKGLEIDHDIKKKIRKTVRKILKSSSLYQISEKKARDEASAQLNVDLSEDPYKIVVREAVASFIEETIEKINGQKGRNRRPDGEREGEGEEKKKKKKSKKKQTSE